MNRNADKLLLILVKNNCHEVAFADVVVNRKLNPPRPAGFRRNRDVALRVRFLNQILFRRDVLLRQVLHALRIVLEFFLLFLDDALSQSSTAGALILRGRIDRRLDRLAVGTHPHLKAFLLALISVQTNGDAFGPRILRQLLLIFRRRFLKLSHARLQIAKLSARRGGKRQRCENNGYSYERKHRYQSASWGIHFLSSVKTDGE